MLILACRAFAQDPAAAAWQTTSNVNRMDGKTTYNFAKSSEDTIEIGDGTTIHPSLVVRCSEAHSPDIFVLTGVILDVTSGAGFHEHGVRLRLDDSKPIVSFWSEGAEVNSQQDAI